MYKNLPIINNFRFEIEKLLLTNTQNTMTMCSVEFNIQSKYGQMSDLAHSSRIVWKLSWNDPLNFNFIVFFFFLSGRVEKQFYACEAMFVTCFNIIWDLVKMEVIRMLLIGQMFRCHSVQRNFHPFILKFNLPIMKKKVLDQSAVQWWMKYRQNQNGLALNPNKVVNWFKYSQINLDFEQQKVNLFLGVKSENNSVHCSPKGTKDRKEKNGKSMKTEFQRIDKHFLICFIPY